MPDYQDMADLFIIPAGHGTEPYVELGSRGTTGAVFRKHVLNLGPLHYQGKTYNLDDEFYGTLKRNFDAGVSMCQVPLADEKNRHSEDPLRNAGEVVGLERDGNKVYTLLDVRDPAVAQKIRDRTIMGASAMLSMNYEDSRTGVKVGPALLHHCITNRPHVLDLEPYQEVVAATADSADMDYEPIVLATEDPVPTKDELLAALKADHGIDVEALQAAAAAKTDTATLSAAIADALAAANAPVQLSGDTLEQSDVVGAIVELARKNETLGEDIKRLNKKDAEREVQSFIDSGRLLAKTKDRAVAVYLSEGQAGLEDWLAPADAPFIRMSESAGTAGEGDGASKQDFDVDAETTRLAGVAEALSGRSKK